jgi:hypothetical protein
MKVCYVAGKYRSNTEWGLVQNIRHAEEVALKLWEEGYAVICPHKNTAHFGGAIPDGKEHEMWIEGDLELLRRSDVVCMLQGWEQSEGAKAEYELAVELGKAIIFEPTEEKA